MAPRLLSHRRGNTLIELMIYVTLSVIILVGLTNIMTRLRQAELAGSAKTDVQQTLRTALQQITSLAQLYDRGAPGLEGEITTEDATELLLWNSIENPSSGMPMQYVRIWHDTDGYGKILLQEVIGGAGSDPIPLTTDAVSIERFHVHERTGQDGTAHFSLDIVAWDRTRASTARTQTDWSIVTSVFLRPVGNTSMQTCCPAFLHFCPQGYLMCHNNGCFEGGQNAANLLGQVNTETMEPLFNQGNVNNGMQEGTSALGLNGPYSLALDRAGRRLFVADTGSHRVLSFPLLPNGSIASYAAEQVFGQPNFTNNTATMMNGPQGVAYNDGLLFVSDTINDRILIFDANDPGEAPLIFTLDDTLTAPRGLAVDPAQKRLFVADSGNNRIVVVDYSDPSALSMIATLTDFPTPKEIAYHNHTLFVAGTDLRIRRILDINNPTNLTVTGTLGNNPNGIAYDAALNRVFVSVGSSSTRSKVRIFTAAEEPGTYVLDENIVLGSEESGIAASNFGLENSASGLAFDSVAQRLFAIDRTRHRILQFSGGGQSCSGADVFVPPGGQYPGLIPPDFNPGDEGSGSVSCPAACAYGDCQDFYADILHSATPISPTTPGIVAATTESYIRTCQQGSASFTFVLPTGFSAPSNGTQITIRAVYGLNMDVTTGTNVTDIEFQLYRSDNNTPLSSNYSVSTPVSSTAWRVETFNVLAQNSGSWPSAGESVRLQIRTTAPTPSVRVAAIQVDLAGSPRAPAGDAAIDDVWGRVPIPEEDDD